VTSRHPGPSTPPAAALRINFGYAEGRGPSENEAPSSSPTGVPAFAGTTEALVAEPWADYGLVDSGGGRKLERYGPWRFIRPEPQAMWAPAAAEWEADGEFIPGSDEEGGGRWQFHRPVPAEGWELSWKEIRFRAQCTPFRHLAFFPDMAPQWAWMREHLGEGPSTGSAQAEVLNLFGYTGVGTLALAASGARVVHVDASKKSVEAGKENARLSGLDDRPIRWMVDDATKFAAREVRRGRRYDGIILDPPKFGRGPAGEIWRLEEGLPGLIADCRRLLDADSRFLVLTVYAVRMSALAIGELLSQALAGLGGRIHCGDMAVREEARGLLLPTAIFARWSRA
jgi:23S rRNA (cytosine1962-C5)-methyltransferase